jgi:hypothetical protein
MGRPKKTATDKIVSLPSDPVERSRLHSETTSVCDIMLKIDALKQTMKATIDANVERGYDRTAFTDWCKLMYDMLYDDNKKRTGIEDKSERAAEVEILANSGRSASDIVDSVTGQTVTKIRNNRNI